MNKTEGVGSVHSLSQEFLRKTIEVWQSYSQERLSFADARDITENITGFFSLLSEWKKQKGEKTQIR